MKTNPNDSIHSAVLRKCGEEIMLASDRDIQIGNNLIYKGGLTKREYFAAKAMQGMLTDSKHNTEEWIAERSVKIADALTKELNATTNIPIKSRLLDIVYKIEANSTSLWNSDLEDTAQCVVIEDAGNTKYNGWVEDIHKLIQEL